MGIRDIVPTIKRHCPQSIISRSSLSAYQGQTLAIDANLFTMKFHHTPDKRPQRVLALWYYFIRTLKYQYNIRPICVFDGAARNPQKAKENFRRQQIRELLKNRASEESDRVIRLQMLQTIRNQLLALDDNQRTAALDVANTLLRQAELSRREAVPPPPPEQELDEEVLEEIVHEEEVQQPDVEELTEPLSADLEKPEIVITQNEPDPMPQIEDPISPIEPDPIPQIQDPIPQIQDPIPAIPAIQDPIPQIQPDPIPAVEEAPEDLPQEIPEQIETHPETTVEEVIISHETIGQALANLYIHHHITPITEKEQVKPSKRQIEILQSERQLFSETFVEDSTAQEESRLRKVLEQSSEVANSYERRASGPSSQVRRDVRTLIEALGIPCITTSNDTPHEGEALAASLVLNGQADAVASEDTDVLFYGTKMLRNLGSGVTSRSIQEISGEDVRQSLGLDRAQFIDLALLCGSDFTARLPGLGPETALKLIKQHGSIEAIFSKPSKYLPADLDFYMTEISLARAIYQNPPAVPTDVDLTLRPEDRNLDSLLRGFGIAEEQMSLEMVFGGNESGQQKIKEWDGVVW